MFDLYKNQLFFYYIDIQKDLVASSEYPLTIFCIFKLPARKSKNMLGYPKPLLNVETKIVLTCFILTLIDKMKAHFPHLLIHYWIL